VGVPNEPFHLAIVNVELNVIEEKGANKELNSS